MTGGPAHSGGLSRWERWTFALALTGMAGLIALITLGAVHASGPGARRADLAADQPPPPGQNVSAGLGARPAGSGGSAGQQAAPGATDPAGPGASRPATPGAASPRSAASPGSGVQQYAALASDLQLAGRLRAALRPFPGHLAVGVGDPATGAWAVYDASASFRAAGLARPDIVAGLLLRAQATGAPADRRQELQAWRLLRPGGHASRSGLWADAGGAPGLMAANRRLGLRHTTLAAADLPDLTGTTAGDQLRLLSDLTSARSPLSKTSRACELWLLRGHRAGRSWLMTAAAADSAGLAGQSAGAGRPPLWAVSGIGVLHRAGQELLVTVLADGQPDRRAALAEVRAAARTAAAQVIAARPALAPYSFPLGTIFGE